MVKVFSTVEEIDRAQWADLIKDSSVSTVFQTPECYDFYCSLSFLRAFAFGVSEDGRLKGVMCGFIQADGGNVKSFLSRRAIVNGGLLLADDISDKAVGELLQAAKRELRKSAIYIETRNFNDYSRWKALFVKNGFDYVPHLNFHLDCLDETAMMGRMSESKVRQIRKSLKNGAQIIEAETEEQVLAFYRILKDLYDTKIKTPLFPESFFLEFFRQKIGKFFLVVKNEDVIGGIMCPILEGKTIYEWFVAGMDKEYKAYYPSIVATYSAMKYGTDHGFERFDFMGAGKPDEGYGVRDFKAKFGGKLVEHGRFLCVNSPLLYGVGKFGVKLLKRK